jgi:hypothetical protein
MTTRRLMILVALVALPLAAVGPARRFRQCAQLAENYAWLRSLEPYARGIVAGTPEQEQLIVEPSRLRAEYYARQQANYRQVAWRFWEAVPQPDPPP